MDILQYIRESINQIDSTTSNLDKLRLSYTTLKRLEKYYKTQNKGNDNVVKFIGSELDFAYESTLDDYKNVAKDILRNPTKYDIPNTQDVYYTHFKYIYIQLPNGREYRLVDFWD